jgi:hypothetical protein
MRALDPRYMSLRRQATSPNNQFMKSWDEDRRAQDMRNRAQVFRNQAMRDLSDRDIQFRNAQEEQDFRRQMAEREFGLREKEMTYKQQQDKLAREEQTRNAKAQYFQSLMRSDDAYARLEGEQGLRSLYEGGQQAPAGAAQTPSAGAAGAAGAAAPAPQAGSYEARLKAIQEKQAEELAAEKERRARTNKREAYNDEVTRMKNEQYFRSQASADERKAAERITEDANASPARKAAAFRRLAQINSANNFPDAPETGGGPFFGAMQGPLSAAFAQGAKNEQERIGNDPLYAVDPTEQKQWETKKSNAANIAAAESVKSAIAVDPVVSSEMQRVRDELRRYQQEGTGHKISRWISNFLLKSPDGLGAAGDYEDYKITDEHVKYVNDTANYLAQLAAQRTGQDPAVVKAIILSDLRSAAGGDSAVAGQIKGALR